MDDKNKPEQADDETESGAKTKSERPLSLWVSDDNKGSDSVSFLNSAVTSVASAAASSSPAAGALLGIGSAAFNVIWSKVRGRREERARRLLEEVVFDTASDEGAAGAYKAILENEESAQDVLITGLRRAMDAVSPIVLPAIGMLTREYWRAGREADRFFRDLGHLLTELVAEEYEPLRDLMHMAASAQDVDEKSPVHLVIESSGEIDPVADATRVVHRSKVGGSNLASENIPHAGRLFGELKANGLATNLGVGVWGGSDAALSMTIKKQIALHIYRLLPSSHLREKA